MPFLQGNTALVIGVVLLIFVAFARALAKEQQLKSDLRGALGWLVTWLALRLMDYAFDALGFAAIDKASRVIWMLAFAFGAVRTTVAFALWTYRRINVGGTPKILRDVLDFVLYVVAAIPILKTQLDIDLTSLLATSAILSVVLGLALQESLGNVFSGLALQLERPFRAGDWISAGEHEGRVVHVAWRATRIETFRSEEVTVPNSNLAKQPVRNYTRGGQPVALDLEVGVSYATPPNVVREEVVSALADVPLILKTPAPVCLVSRFADSAVTYLVRFYIADYRSQPDAVDQAYTRLWYRFSRAGIEIPYPQRVVHMKAQQAASPHLTLLSGLDLFTPFSSEQRAELARAAVERRFGRGEAIIREGDDGHTFYVIVSGEVAVARGGNEIARLSRGAYLGEMSLLTGEPRSATVVATSDVVVLELDRQVFSKHFAENPERAQQLSELLAQRRSELDAVASATGANAPEGAKANEILRRLKSIFRLS